MNLKQRVRAAFLELDVPLDLSGITYIADIMEMIDDPTYKVTKLGELYSKTGGKHNVSCSMVERNIRHVFATAYKTADKKVLEKYFGKTENHSNGNLLYTLHFKLTCEVNKDEN